MRAPFLFFEGGKRNLGEMCARKGIKMKLAPSGISYNVLPSSLSLSLSPRFRNDARKREETHFLNIFSLEIFIRINAGNGGRPLVTSLPRSEQSPPTVPHSFPSDKAALKCKNRRESGSRRRRVSVPSSSA